MEVLILHPKTKKEMSAMQKVARALKIRFETQKGTALAEREKAILAYGKEFVEKIELGDKDREAGRLKVYHTHAHQS